MNRIIDTCKKEIEGSTLLSFSKSDSMYIFGSSLYLDRPNDVDILLVYADRGKIRRVQDLKNQIVRVLSPVLYGIDFHFVTLSQRELKQTKFLTKVKSQRIK